MVRYCLIGPTYPFRGGIAHYTTLLALELLKEHEVLLISFQRQYPSWLFPGRNDRDPSQRPLQTRAEHLLDPLNPLSWHRTLKRIREWKAEVVVIPWWVPFWAPTWAILGRGVKRMPHKPKLIFICHNVLPHEKSIIDKLALQIALSPGDGYILHSQADAKQLLAKFPEAKVRITPLPTYAALAVPGNNKMPVEIPADRPLLLFCGFVRHYKGLDVLLDALPKVLAERDVHLLAAGEFWDGTDSYQKQIRSLGIEGAVTLLDRYLSNEELIACVDAADVVVLPYRSATQSAIVQVAFGRGRPVITTDVGGLPEVVEHGRTGLIVPPEDPDALGEAILQYIIDDLINEFMANLERNRDRYSWNELIEALDDLQMNP